MQESPLSIRNAHMISNRKVGERIMVTTIVKEEWQVEFLRDDLKT
jgi:hypothetical protein